ncbi:MAG: hypothetical protein QOE23_3011, partial [Pseudonocardiales bacterium]|nr:hypothetical protein [Pseudonocardiales bacterium]
AVRPIGILPALQRSASGVRRALETVGSGGTR